MPRPVLLLLVLPMLLGTAACGGNDDEAPDAAAQETPDAQRTAEEDAAAGAESLTVTAIDYEFDLPETLPAGERTLTLVNEGEEPHFIEIVELKDDAPSVDELIKIRKADKFFVRRAGGTPPVKPGEESDPVDLDLTAGRYGYVCFIETKDGEPHAFLGMAGEFTVE